MSTDRSDPTLVHTLPTQITKKIWRDVPPELSPTLPENSAQGKIIVITGGGTGIGAGSARIWVLAGAEAVVIAGRRKEVLDKTAADLEALAKSSGVNTKILAVQTDITKEASTSALFSAIKASFGRTADVVLSNAGFVSALMPPHKETVETWWSVYEINVLGTHNLAMSFIKSQADPDKAVGTFVSVNSSLSAALMPGVAAYSTAKLAIQRYVEYLDLEYPTLRVFSIYPGLVATDLADKRYYEFCGDKAEQTGALALYLASPRAEYLRGSLISINWDIGELQEHKAEIEKGLLKIKVNPIYPAVGGSGL